MKGFIVLIDLNNNSEQKVVLQYAQKMYGFFILPNTEGKKP